MSFKCSKWGEWSACALQHHQQTASSGLFIGLHLRSAPSSARPFGSGARSKEPHEQSIRLLRSHARARWIFTGRVGSQNCLEQMHVEKVAIIVISFRIRVLGHLRMQTYQVCLRHAETSAPTRWCQNFPLLPTPTRNAEQGVFGGLLPACFTLSRCGAFLGGRCRSGPGGVAPGLHRAAAALEEASGDPQQTGWFLKWRGGVKGIELSSYLRIVLASLLPVKNRLWAWSASQILDFCVSVLFQETDSSVSPVAPKTAPMPAVPVKVESAPVPQAKATSFFWLDNLESIENPEMPDMCHISDHWKNRKPVGWTMWFG